MVWNRERKRITVGNRKMTNVSRKNKGGWVWEGSEKGGTDRRGI